MISKLEIADDEKSCFTIYHLQINNLGLNSELQFTLTMWLYSIILKLVKNAMILFR